MRATSSAAEPIKECLRSAPVTCVAINEHQQPLPQKARVFCEAGN